MSNTNKQVDWLHETFADLAKAYNPRKQQGGGLHRKKWAEAMKAHNPDWIDSDAPAADSGDNAWGAVEAALSALQAAIKTARKQKADSGLKVSDATAKQLAAALTKKIAG